MAYGTIPDALSAYLQMGATTSLESLDYFSKSVMEFLVTVYLRKPTYTDVEKLYVSHKEKHRFSGMLGSLDCAD